MNALEGLIAELADAVAERVASKLRAQHDGWIDQTRSALGRKRHCAAVRRRLESDDAGAAIAGRRHLLSREALQAELAATSTKRKRAGVQPAPSDDLGPYLEKYGIRRAG